MGRDEYSLARLRGAVEHAAASAPSVSQWSVGMHVHHCALSMIAIGNGLARCAGPVPPAKASIAKHVVFTIGRIPRGRAKSGKNVSPQPAVPADELLGLIDESHRQMDVARDLHPDTWITHPVFGPLRRDDALKFARIHNHHHLKIISDILKRQS